jgi:hypothetical protein
MSGFAAKRLYVRALNDEPPVEDVPEAWGWSTRTIEGWQGHTHTVYEPGHAKMVGYLDADYLYLLPDPLREYLAHASRSADQAWPVDAATLYRELDEANLIESHRADTITKRLKLKKIHGHPTRLLWVRRARLLEVLGEGDSGETASVPGDEPDDGITL